MTIHSFSFLVYIDTFVSNLLLSKNMRFYLLPLINSKFDSKCKSVKVRGQISFIEMGIKSLNLYLSFYFDANSDVEEFH